MHSRWTFDVVAVGVTVTLARLRLFFLSVVRACSCIYPLSSSTAVVAAEAEEEKGKEGGKDDLLSLYRVCA